MILTATTKVRCPSCGKNLQVSVDISTPQEYFIEECKFCRESLQIASKTQDGRLVVTAEKLSQPAQR